MSIVSAVISLIRSRWECRSSAAYCDMLRKTGCKIGQDVQIRFPFKTNIDASRPSLVTIGEHVDINRNFTLLTHDYGSFVFRRVFNDFIPSSGAVTIGNNVVIGVDVTVLKGVTIGDNCIIGAGAVVTHSIPSNSVAAGVPAKVICSLEDYYKSRQEKSIEEALAYARRIKERFGRRPVITDFQEEFVLWISGGEEEKYPECPVRQQLRGAYDEWHRNHKAPFKDFEDFLKHAGV